MPIFDPNKKALFITIFFSVVEILSWKYKVKDWQASLPLGVFYIILVINTYFSVNLFSQIIPSKNRIQHLFDFILIILYISVALSIKQPFTFVFFLLLMFIVATIKYSLLLGTIDHLSLLKKKILVDLIGILACTIALSGISSGYTMYSTWILTICFVLTNILLFFIWPLYRLDNTNKKERSGSQVD